VTTTKPTGDNVTIALRLRFNDAMTLGLYLARAIRAGDLDDGSQSWRVSYALLRHVIDV